jgi:hypothetical protein
LAALAGTLYLSMGMQLKACPLCLYQRVFVMGAAGVLLVGIMLPGVRPGVVSLLALPAAVGGLAIAGWHNYLEASGVLECPRGVAGFGSAPQQSLAVFALLVVVLLFDVLMSRLLVPGLIALVLGGAFAAGAIASAPKNPAPDYSVPVDEDGCRKIKT